MDSVGNPTHEEWLAGGGMEHATRPSTLRQPHQNKRLDWLRRRVVRETLDVGCNWGYSTNYIYADVGLDINPTNIDFASLAFPQRKFVVGDARFLPFKGKSFATVVLADILEHLGRSYAVDAVVEACRVARENILITLPWKQDDKCACCFKHEWIPDWHTISFLGVVAHEHPIKIEIDDYFCYIEVFLD